MYASVHPRSLICPLNLAAPFHILLADDFDFVQVEATSHAGPRHDLAHRLSDGLAELQFLLSELLILRI